MSESEVNVFDVWLASGVAAVADVPIFGDMQAVVDLQRVEEKIKAAKVNGRSTKALNSERDEILDRLEASRAVWTLRALTGDEEAAVRDRLGGPVLPPDIIKEGATEAEREAWLVEYRDWSERSANAVRDLSIARIAQAVVRVATPGGVAEGVTEEQLRTMHAAEYGPARLLILSEAVDAITNTEVDVSRPM